MLLLWSKLGPPSARCHVYFIFKGFLGLLHVIFCVIPYAVVLFADSGVPRREADPSCSWSQAEVALAKARLELRSLPAGGGFSATARNLLLLALRACPRDSAVLTQVGEGFRLLGEPAAAVAVFTCGALIGVWQHPLQRPKGGFKLYKWLESTAVFERDALADFPELRAAISVVEARLHVLRLEFLRARRSRGDEIVAAQHVCSEEHGCWEWQRLDSDGVAGRWYQGAWKQYALTSQISTDPYHACAESLFPSACGILTLLKDDLGLSVVGAQIREVDGPITYIPLQSSDPLQEQVRLNCVMHSSANSSFILRFPGFMEKRSEKGKCFWFDASFEHELLHVGGRSASLIVDVRHPGLDGRLLRGAWVNSLVRSPQRSSSSGNLQSLEKCINLPNWPTRAPKSTAPTAQSSRFNILGRGENVFIVEVPGSRSCDISVFGKCGLELRIHEGSVPQQKVQMFAQKHGLQQTEARNLLDYASTFLTYHAGNDQPWSPNHGGEHSRTTVLQHLRHRFGYDKGMYLELGCGKGDHFVKIAPDFAHSACVDPKAGTGETHHMTSDRFFESYQSYHHDHELELVLVDGLHTGEQAFHDVQHALAHLKPGGAIVMHDCNPNSYLQANPVPSDDLWPYLWTGDVFKAVIALRQLAYVDVAVGDFDFGVGVVLPRPRSIGNLPMPKLNEHEIWNMSYADFSLRRRDFLGLMPWEQLVRWIG